MVITPDVSVLPFIMNHGIKYFELVAEPVKREILPGVYIKGMGYNGSIPGPTIQVFTGDCVCIRVINRLTEATSVHWHGLDIPNDMDGVPEMEPTPAIEPGDFFDYYFKITNPPGTHMYHTHLHALTQQMMGLGGGFIILDQNQRNEVSGDFFLMMGEFALKGLPMGEVKPGEYDIDPMSHNFNFFTINGRCFPYTTPLSVKCGDCIRIRLGNIGHDAHPMHIHGHQFVISASDGNTIPAHSSLAKNTVNVASGETYDVIFMADNPGNWPFHCHIPHHMSNNMQDSMGGMVTAIRYS